MWHIQTEPESNSVNALNVLSREHAIQSSREFVKLTFNAAQLDADIIEATRLIAFERVEIVSARISLNLSLDGFDCCLCRQL